ncbi:acyl-CoA dehydrogenase family protein [Thermodesulfobacteriota bacterium]
MDREELGILLESVGKFMEREIDPHADEIDLYPAKPHPFDLFDRVFQAGLMRLEDMDDDFLRPANVVKLLIAMSGHCAGVAAFTAYTIAGEIFRRSLGGGDTSPGVVSIALFEEADIGVEECRFDFSTSLERGVVRGTKRSVMLAPRSDLVAVFCRAGDKGRIAWVKADSKKVKIGTPVGLIGARALPCADVDLDGAKALAVEDLEPGCVARLLARMGLYTAACACGTAMAALRAARQYAAERYQGGKVIEKHDAVRLLYAKNIAAVESATAALVAAAEAFEDDGVDSWIRSIRAGAVASEASATAAVDAVQVLGGYGYMRDFGLEKRLRDAVALSVLPIDGTRASLFCDSLDRR